MKYELREAKGEVEEKNGNAKAVKVLLKAAQRRLATTGGEKNRMKRGGED